MVDSTSRDPTLKARFPEFAETCREDLREGGPERLNLRATQLERRVQELTEKAEGKTSVAKNTVLKLLRRHHDDAGDYIGDLEHVADQVAKGADHPLFDGALTAEIESIGSDKEEEIRMQYEWPIERSVDSREAVSVAKGKLRLVRYLLDDWSRGEFSRPLSKKTERFATDTQVRHLRTARSVLQDESSIRSQSDFESAVEERDEPASSVRKLVQELGKEILDCVHLPKHYSGFPKGFRRLVDDLWKGQVSL